jgi:hypothetical protein
MRNSLNAEQEADMDLSDRIQLHPANARHSTVTPEKHGIIVNSMRALRQLASFIKIPFLPTLPETTAQQSLAL